ncbi:histone-lysine N-methyltransferase SETMAR [Trichonephila clavipes]|nr:histone-lysine N-methyltransferase SETMAR [Trichonephila clavipes]
MSSNIVSLKIIGADSAGVYVKYIEAQTSSCWGDGKIFFDKVENASQVAEIVNGVYGANTVTANYVKFCHRRFRSGIFDVKDAARTGRPVVENLDKITETIEVVRHVTVAASPRS